MALFNLRRAGYELTPAADGQEGLSLFSPEKFDLVITDVKVDLEKKVIDRALRRNKGNMTRTAAYLRIPRHVLVYRLEKYGIRRETRQRNLREAAE